MWYKQQCVAQPLASPLSSPTVHSVQKFDHPIWIFGIPPGSISWLVIPSVYNVQSWSEPGSTICDCVAIWIQYQLPIYFLYMFHMSKGWPILPLLLLLTPIDSIYCGSATSFSRIMLTYFQLVATIGMKSPPPRKDCYFSCKIEWML